MGLLQTVRFRSGYAGSPRCNARTLIKFARSDAVVNGLPAVS